MSSTVICASDKENFVKRWAAKNLTFICKCHSCCCASHNMSRHCMLSLKIQVWRCCTSPSHNVFSANVSKRVQVTRNMWTRPYEGTKLPKQLSTTIFETCPHKIKRDAGDGKRCLHVVPTLSLPTDMGERLIRLHAVRRQRQHTTCPMAVRSSSQDRC